MYVSARSWGIQPSEFWEMTFAEWLAEAYENWRATPEGQLAEKRQKWLEDASLTDEEWERKYGIAKDLR